MEEMKKMRKFKWSLVMLTALAAGCSNDKSTTTPGPDGSTDSAAGKNDSATGKNDSVVVPGKTLRIGYLGNTHHAAHFVAMVKGLYTDGLKKVGITTITDTEYANGGQEIDALRADKLDAALVGLAPVIAGKTTNPPFDGKIVGTIGLQGSTMVVSKDVIMGGTTITAEELKAMAIPRKILTLASGSIQDAVLKMWLTKIGVTYSGENPDFTVEGMASAADAILKLNNKDVQAVFYPEPWPTQALSGPNKVAIRSGTMWPNHPCCVLVVSAKMITEQPAAVKEMIRVIKTGAEYTLTHIGEVAGIIAAKIGEDTLMVKKSLTEWDGKYASSPHDAIPGTMAVVEFKKSTLTKADLFDTSFFDQL